MRRFARVIAALAAFGFGYIVFLYLTLPDVRGPLPWAAGSPANVCTADWTGTPPSMPGVCALFDACGDGGIPTDPPLCPGDPGEGGAGTGGTGGSGGAGGTGGSGGGAAGSGARDGGGTGGTGGAGGSIVADGPMDDCGCRLPGAPGANTAGAWAMVVAAALFARRRRTH